LEQSERATYICWHEWIARSQLSERRGLASSMAEQAKEVRYVATTGELRALDERKVGEICKHLDELSSRWSSLEVGQSMAVRWPDLAVAATPQSL
jgi:adenosyl cobinamide kinase/adenosyl cobinamide phosphate guanylyltransferase